MDGCSRLPRRREQTIAGRGLNPARWFVLAALFALDHGAPLRAAPPAPRTMQSRLEEPVDAAWSGVPLRELARRLSDTAHVPIIVDRRLDPDRRLSVVADGDPLGEVLARIATGADASVVILDAHVRLVPPDSAAALTAAATLRDREILALDKATRQIAMSRAAWEWPEAAQPRQLVAAAAAAAGIGLVGLDRLPHDHFPAATLPQLPLAVRLDLLLAHFDRRVEWKPRDGDGPPQFAIVPLEAPPTGAVVAPATDATSRTRPQPRPNTASQTYSLRVEAPLDELLATLARRFGLALELDRESLKQRGIAAGEIVRRAVKDASRDELLDAILEPLGLGWKISGDKLHVGAK